LIERAVTDAPPRLAIGKQVPGVSVLTAKSNRRRLEGAILHLLALTPRL
jgi:hypothetical protein